MGSSPEPGVLFQSEAATFFARGHGELDARGQRRRVTHLAISLAIRAAESGRRVYYGSRVLVSRSRRQRRRGNSGVGWGTLTYPALLAVEGIG